MRARPAGLPGTECSSPPKPRYSTGSAVEFDPNGMTSRLSLDPAAQPTSTERPRGFVYDGVRAGRAIRAGLSRRPAASRPLPMEEVTLYVKPLDNVQVRRKPDPKGRRAWLRLVTSGCAVLLVVMLGYGPRAWLRHAGYRQAKQEEQYRALLEISRQLQVREAMLSDLQRITELASAQGLTAPPPERFAWQDRTIMPASDGGELAQSRGPDARPYGPEALLPAAASD